MAKHSRMSINEANQAHTGALHHCTATGPKWSAICTGLSSHLRQGKQVLMIPIYTEKYKLVEVTLVLFKAPGKPHLEGYTQPQTQERGNAVWTERWSRRQPECT